MYSRLRRRCFHLQSSQKADERQLYALLVKVAALPVPLSAPLVLERTKSQVLVQWIPSLGLQPWRVVLQRQEVSQR